MKRTVINRYEDLLPEILIEAQSCDEITALAALRRAIEWLCNEYDFFTETIYAKPSANEDDEWIKVYVDERNILNVFSVVQITNGNEADEQYVYWKYVKPNTIYIRNISSPGTEDDISFKIHMSYMPDLDSGIPNRDIVTKWRNLIVSKTLEDLFSMEGKPWANAARFQIYSMKASKNLENFIFVEQIRGHDSRPKKCSLSPAKNIFC